MHVVICGGGVIGAATAYFLTELGVEVTLVERCSIAAAASGKAGGFLARDWCDGNAMGPLARASFDLHAELAERLDTDYGYRRVDTLMVAGADEGSVAAYARLVSPAWLDGNCAVHGRIGTPETTAQVEPGAFTRALVDAACRGGGARVRIGAVEGLATNARGAARSVGGVVVDGEVFTADAVVLAMGPWTALAREWLPLPPIGGLKGFSITLRPELEIPAEMLFCEYRTAGGETLSPEIYPRPDGEVWVCGISDDQPVPLDPADIRVDDARCDELRRIAGALATGLADAEITRRQACYRPICADALPLLGSSPGRPGVFVATGHNCWGILNAPASGKAMAELIATGEARCVDLAPFDPARLLKAA